MRTITYLMHVPWGWAKQRPHFLALELAKQNNVTVYFNKSYRKSNQRVEQSGNLTIKELFILPFGNRLKLISRINELLLKWQLDDAVLAKSDFVWVTSPVFASIQVRNKRVKVIYDCMDDFLEFPIFKEKPWLQARYRALEKHLVQNLADCIFFSSLTLQKRVLNRYSLKQGATTDVINNAITEIANIKLDGVGSTANDKGKINIVYIGTVSAWLDFDLVEQHLKADSNVVYNLYGPTEIQIPKVDGLFYHGPIPHASVFKTMLDANILIMPFIVNDLIKAVNPVKLYEYIFTGKAIVAARYSESEKFEDFVYLYEGHEEYISKMHQLKTSGCPAKRGLTDCHAFVESNTWTRRGKTIHERLVNLVTNN